MQNFEDFLDMDMPLMPTPPNQGGVSQRNTPLQPQQPQTQTKDIVIPSNMPPQARKLLENALRKNGTLSPTGKLPKDGKLTVPANPQPPQSPQVPQPRQAPQQPQQPQQRPLQQLNSNIPKPTQQTSLEQQMQEQMQQVQQQFGQVPPQIQQPQMQQPQMQQQQPQQPQQLQPNQNRQVVDPTATFNFSDERALIGFFQLFFGGIDLNGKLIGLTETLVYTKTLLLVTVIWHLSLTLICDVFNLFNLTPLIPMKQRNYLLALNALIHLFNLQKSYSEKLSTTKPTLSNLSIRKEVIPMSSTPLAVPKRNDPEPVYATQTPTSLSDNELIVIPSRQNMNTQTTVQNMNQNQNQNVQSSLDTVLSEDFSAKLNELREKEKLSVEDIENQLSKVKALKQTTT